eukprot:351462-Chlamydomonas_euryale.AAC.8
MYIERAASNQASTAAAACIETRVSGWAASNSGSCDINTSTPLTLLGEVVVWAPDPSVGPLPWQV